jgi:hypothetical protein
MIESPNYTTPFNNLSDSPSKLKKVLMSVFFGTPRL